MNETVDNALKCETKQTVTLKGKARGIGQRISMILWYRCVPSMKYGAHQPFRMLPVIVEVFSVGVHPQLRLQTLLKIIKSINSNKMLAGWNNEVIAHTNHWLHSESQLPLLRTCWIRYALPRSRWWMRVLSRCNPIRPKVTEKYWDNSFMQGTFRPPSPPPLGNQFTLENKDLVYASGCTDLSTIR